MNNKEPFVWKNSGDIKYLTSSDLPKGLIAGFFGREKGNSKEPFDSLDLAFHVGDEYSAVVMNWEGVVAGINGQPINSMSNVLDPGSTRRSSSGKTESTFSNKDQTLRKVNLIRQAHTAKILNLKSFPRSEISETSLTDHPRILSKKAEVKLASLGSHAEHISFYAKKNPYDAQFTNLKKIAITVLTADCVPILVYDDDATAIGAIHAGWKGTVKKITLRSIMRMIKEMNLDPKKLNVWIGPSIGPCCFEVGEDVADKFETLTKDHIGMTTNKFKRSPISLTSVISPPSQSDPTNKKHIDLKEFNAVQALQAGVPTQRIKKSGYCTSCRNDIFFSYRKNARTGRQAAVIALIS